MSIVGFVLSSHPDALQTLFDKITTKVPGSVGQTLSESIQTAIDKRAGVGIIGLAGVLLTGLGWIGNLRRAIDAVWAREAAKRSFLKDKISSLLILAGLGLGLLASVALTAVWTALSGQVLALLNLDDVPGMGTLLGVAGIAIAVVGDAVVFVWLLVRLPVADIPRSIGVRGAVLGAVGFEILKIVGTYTVASASSSSPTAGPFAGLIAVLVWIQLVVRWFLFVVAVTAVLTERETAAEASAAAAEDPDLGPSLVVAEPGSPALSPAAVGATLVGAGAVAGAAAVALAQRRGKG